MYFTVVFSFLLFMSPATVYGHNLCAKIQEAKNKKLM